MSRGGWRQNAPVESSIGIFQSHRIPPLRYDPPMFLADLPTGPITAVVNTLDGVTTVLTAFVFVCLILPSLVRYRPQYYMALACVAGIIIVHTLMLLFNLPTFGAVLIGVLQLMALLLLVLSVGGLTVKELGGEMARAYEVIRRGETEKEVIIPIGGDQPVAPRRTKGEDPPRKVYKINTPINTPVEEEEGDKGIPLA